MKILSLILLIMLASPIFAYGANTTIIDGTGIDTSDSGSNITFSWDSTEINTTTWSDGTGVTWTFDASAGTDPKIEFGNNIINVTGNLQQAGNTVITVANTTTDLTEGTNLYYTSARWRSDFGNDTTANLTEGSNLYYTSARWRSDFGNDTTGNLTEGSNLYYTSARWITDFGNDTSDNLTEGATNLYESTTVSDTATINLTLTTVDITADVNLSLDNLVNYYNGSTTLAIANFTNYFNITENLALDNLTNYWNITTSFNNTEVIALDNLTNYYNKTSDTIQINFAVSNPHLLYHAGRLNNSSIVWFNNIGQTVTITNIRAMADVDNYNCWLFKTVNETDVNITNDVQLDLINCSTDGDGGFLFNATAFDNATIEQNKYLIFEHANVTNATNIQVHINGTY